MSAARLPAGSVPTDTLTVPAGAVVVTDLHLSPEGDPRTDAFITWWNARLPRPPMLIVLGDLFDTWVGPKQGRLEGSARVLAFFRDLAAQGIEVHLVPGNRDALMGADVEEAAGASVHLEGFLGMLADGSRAVFVHGDGLCTLDTGYQRLRRIWRCGLVRGASRWVPLFVARAVARRLRRRSERAKPLKLAAERAIRPEAVDALASATDAALVVCGHAHDPQDSRAPGGARWIVVGAFGEGRGAEVLELRASGVRMIEQG